MFACSAAHVLLQLATYCFDNTLPVQVYYRGIVEFSNVCANDCGYCGIRKHMPGVKRYTIPVPEVVEAAKWSFENKMGTIMLQVRL